MNATDMVKAAYRSCLGHYGYYDDEAGAIRRVLKKHGIDEWPSTKTFRSYLDVLNITGLEPLFGIEVTRTRQKFPTNIIEFTTASSYALPWREWPNYGIGKRRAVTIETEYKYLIKNIILLLSNEVQDLETIASSIICMEKAMAKFDEMRRDRVSGFWTEPTLSLSGLSPFFENGFPLWSLLASHFKKANITLKSTDRVHLPFLHLTRAVVNWTELVNSTDLYNFIGWLWILRYINVAGGQLTQYFEEFEENTQFSLRDPNNWQDVCLDALVTDETTMYAPAANLYLEKYFTPEEKIKALNMVWNIKAQLVTLVNKNPWMNTRAREIATERIKKIHFRIGYDDFFVNMTYVNKLYTFVNKTSFHQETPFIEIYYELHRNQELKFMNMLRTRGYKYDYRFGPFLAHGYYDAHRNILLFQAAALQGRLSEERIPKSYMYGGFGATLAFHLARTVEATYWDGHETSVTGARFIWDGISMESQCRYGNSKPVEVKMEELSFAAYVESHLAFKAYKSALSDTNVEYTLPIDTALTPEQLFFATFGQRYCKRAGLGFSAEEREKRLNLQMKLDPSFAETYSCPKYNAKLKEKCKEQPEKRNPPKPPKKNTVMLAAVGAVVQLLFNNNISDLEGTNIQTLEAALIKLP
uniref:Putative m13 family peptidase n=1 Tax=Ixodes ricinus TaxID=34613 RepID=A0A6B0VFH7_IXORI